jgi:hypothetical protein
MLNSFLAHSSPMKKGVLLCPLEIINFDTESLSYLHGSQNKHYLKFIVTQKWTPS